MFTGGTIWILTHGHMGAESKPHCPGGAQGWLCLASPCMCVCVFLACCFCYFVDLFAGRSEKHGKNKILSGS